MIRIVEGDPGDGADAMDLVLRFDYGSIIPWVHQHDGALHAIAGPDAVVLHSPIKTHGEGMRTVADFTVRAKERISFVLTYQSSLEQARAPVDCDGALDRTSQWWRRWCPAQVRG